MNLKNTLQRVSAPAPLICLALALLTALCYWPMTQHSFVTIDDPAYLLDNSHVKSGLTWAGAAWAFQTGYFSNWHPLTWISYMLDCQLYGLNPGGHHLTNLLFHIANSLLLFLLLRQLTGRLWPSAFVAALFALHPLHVESVAWASERKDVLSAFFWILTMMAYTSYVRKPGLTRYLMTLLLFALGLMSKPMVVTLPFVLLLFDFWPLGRLGFGRLYATDNSAATKKCRNVVRDEAQDARTSTEPYSTSASVRSIGWLVCEKLPLFALALAASVVTYLVQEKGGATSSLEAVPIGLRISNALVAYVRYLSKTLWPADLSPFYPLSAHLQAGWVAAAALLLAGLSGLFLWRARREPFLITGWLWFLGTLVPVIGLVQVGAQSMADRYMYMPAIGLFLLVVWGLDSLLRTLPGKREILAGAGVLGIAGCLVGTGIQLKYWQNSEQLFRHALAVMPDNYLAQDGMGKAWDDLGKKDEALSCFAASVLLAPHYPVGQYNLGTLLMEKGKLEEAINHFKAALETNPKFADAHYSLGNAFLKLGSFSEAREQLSDAVLLKPDEAGIRYSLGTALLMQSDLEGAVIQLAEALRLNPQHAEAHRNLGVALMRQGKPAAAITHFSEAARLDPGNPQMRFNFGLALLEQNKPGEAAAQLAEAVRLRPADVPSHYRLAAALALQNKSAEAIFQYRETLRLRPDFPDALNELAWLLASDPDPRLRAGAEAIGLAEKACALTEHPQPAMMTTLAAAYAEGGRLPEAVATAQKARDLALATGEKDSAAKAAELARLYESRQLSRRAL